MYSYFTCSTSSTVQVVAITVTVIVVARPTASVSQKALLLPASQSDCLTRAPSLPNCTLCYYPHRETLQHPEVHPLGGTDSRYDGFLKVLH